MTIWLNIGGRNRRVEVPEPAFVSGNNGTQSFVVDGQRIDADVRMLQTGVLSFHVDGQQYSCVLDGDAIVIKGKRFEFSLVDPRSLTAQQGLAGTANGPRVVKASMPGRVVRVLVEGDDTVEKGQGLIVIEAMKMQNELKSPKAGRVVKIAAAVGTTVSAGDVLVVVE